VHASDGSRVGTLCIIDNQPRDFSAGDQALLADLAAMVDRELSLLTMATIDELTQLSNRHGFTEIATHLLALCRRHGKPAALLVLDLNGFKQINDSLGHAVGDDVLRMFGRLLLKHFRTSDIVARLGGDEFCVLEGGATEAQLGESLARFAADFSGSVLAKAHPGLSWSSGIVGFDPASRVDLDALLKAADQKMYGDKRRWQARWRSGAMP